MTFSDAETAVLIAALRALQRRGVEPEEVVILEAGDVDVAAIDADIEELVERLQFEGRNDS